MKIQELFEEEDYTEEYLERLLQRQKKIKQRYVDMDAAGEYYNNRERYEEERRIYGVIRYAKKKMGLISTTPKKKPHPDETRRFTGWHKDTRPPDDYDRTTNDYATPDVAYDDPEPDYSDPTFDAGMDELEKIKRLRRFKNK